jgi:hypothetical protein
MTQRAHPDLSPWIFVGVLALSAAISSATGLTAQAATSNDDSSATRPAAPIAPALPAAAAHGGGSVAAAPAPAPATAAAQAPRAAAAARPQLPPGQVWQCVIDGGRVFSDAPCGEHASIRRLSDLNVMDSPRQGDAYAYGYAPMHVPAATSAPAPADDSDYSDYPSPDLPWVYGRARQHYIPRHDARVQPQPHPHPHPRRN